MTLLKLSVSTILLLILFACNQTAKQPDNIKKIDTAEIDTTRTAIINSIASTKKADGSIKNKDLEAKIIDTIFKLTEVTERAKYIDEQTKGKRHLKIWVADTPNLPDHKYYWIKAGEDNGTNLVTHFNFYVYTDSMRIMYFETQSNSVLTINKWRKINGM